MRSLGLGALKGAITIGMGMGLVACAGPTTPFGAIWTLTPPEKQAAGPEADSGPALELVPPRQVLHGVTRLTVKLPEGVSVRESDPVRVYYGGRDATPKFGVRVETDGSRDAVHIPEIRLPDHRDHDVRVEVVTADGSRLRKIWKRPRCEMKDREARVHSTDPFQVHPALRGVVIAASRELNVNPALVAGLIAQESGFNPRAVSWAKAIGLTQVTGSAADEIADVTRGWPRYPGLDGMNLISLRARIAAGEVNRWNEWRLNPHYSVHGGVSYLKRLYGDWYGRGPASHKNGLSEEEEILRLALASYHSGPTRVRRIFSERGEDWLLDSELKAARKYVNRVTSYCDSFSQEDGDENET